MPCTAGELTRAVCRWGTDSDGAWGTDGPCAGGTDGGSLSGGPNDSRPIWATWVTRHSAEGTMPKSGGRRQSGHRTGVTAANVAFGRSSSHSFRPTLARMAVRGRPAALLTNTLRGIRRFRVGRKEDPRMTSESSAKDGQSGHEGTKSGIRGRLELADYPSVTGEPVPTREASLAVGPANE